MKALIRGFLFGAFGLYIVAMGALIFAPIEAVGDILFVPGRFLSERFVGEDGSNFAVACLTVANGIFYAIVFYIISPLFKKRS